jgi:large subunit ribosomal protein L1
MPKRSKKYEAAVKQFDQAKEYNLKEAIEILRKVNLTKYSPSVDVAVRLGVDPRQANQMVRGVAALPHGTGKNVRVLVLTGPEREQDAKDAGAEFVGLDDYLEKIAGGWTDVDVIICSPDVMPKVGRLGKVLGPRGLMPNPKTGTVTTDVGKATREVKAGKIDFKVDKTGNIHAAVGKLSFTTDQLAENALEVLTNIVRLKPVGLKDTYLQAVHLSTTMSPSVKIDKSIIN